MVSTMFRYGTKHWEDNKEKAEIFHAFTELITAWKPSSKQAFLNVINILKAKFKMLWETISGGPNLSLEVTKYLYLNK